MIPPAEVLPRGDAVRYGLVPKGEWDGTLPVTPEGGLSSGTGLILVGFGLVLGS